jgi:hypothetical protein
LEGGHFLMGEVPLYAPRERGAGRERSREREIEGASARAREREREREREDGASKKRVARHDTSLETTRSPIPSTPNFYTPKPQSHYQMCPHATSHGTEARALWHVETECSGSHSLSISHSRQARKPEHSVSTFQSVEAEARFAPLHAGPCPCAK